ncbi:MAG: hypothetical protein JRH16_22560, partial [Deltaproteobacteria bacterium]|nr:hypothetical protein [Deltaproteobacteria bacterium]
MARASETLGRPGVESAGARVPSRARARSWAPLGLLLAAALATAEARAGTITSWNGGASTWGTAGEWDTGVVPKNGTPNPADTYDAVVGAGTVTLDLDVTIDELEHTGGTIDGAGFSLQIDDLFTWKGGTLTGTGTTSALAAASITGTANKFLEGGHTLVAQGTTTWDDGDLFLQGAGTTFQNEGTFVAAAGLNDRLTFSVAGASFDNQGTFRKQGTTALTTVD